MLEGVEGWKSHPGISWETRVEGALLFVGLREVAAVPPGDCVYVCVPYGNVLLPYFVSQGKAGSGLLPLSWPFFPPLEVVFKKRSSQTVQSLFCSRFFFFLVLFLVLFYFLLHVVGELEPSRQPLNWLEFEDQNEGLRAESHWFQVREPLICELCLRWGTWKIWPQDWGQLPPTAVNQCRPTLRCSAIRFFSFFVDKAEGVTEGREKRAGVGGVFLNQGP